MSVEAEVGVAHMIEFAKERKAQHAERQMVRERKLKEERQRQGKGRSRSL